MPRIAGEPYTVGPAEGLRILKPAAQKSVQGTLYGGCLSILVSLLGTPWEPATENKLLFFEDVGVKPYQIDRMLWQLRAAGKLAGVCGIIFGEMVDCVSAALRPIFSIAQFSALSTASTFPSPSACAPVTFRAECHAHLRR